MECCKTTRELSAYARGDLEGPELAGVEVHLASCAMCAARVAELRAFQSRVRESLQEPVASPGISDSVMMLLPSEVRPVRRHWVWAPTAVILVVALIAAPHFRTDRSSGHAPHAVRAAMLPPGPPAVRTSPSGDVTTTTAVAPVTERMGHGGPRSPRWRRELAMKSADTTSRRAARGEQAALSDTTPADDRTRQPVLTIAVEESHAPSDGFERRNRLVVRVPGADRVIEHGSESVILPSGQAPDSSSIVRPPLETVRRPM